MDARNRHCRQVLPEKRTETIAIAFDNSYSRLPDRFYARVNPERPPLPKPIALNRELAIELGLDPVWLEQPEGLDFLTGREVVGGSDPIAIAYAGHQFGNFVPQLGDGRAILLGEVIDANWR
jgi:serine/tyrosine/threonine adenylyltransferase